MGYCMKHDKNILSVLLGFIFLLVPNFVLGQFKLVDDSSGNLKISFKNTDYVIKQETIAGNDYDFISTDILTSTSDVGAPNLPFLSTTIQLQNTGYPNLKIKVLKSKIIENVRIKPYQEDDYQSYFLERELYSKDEFYPQEIAQISHPAILRNTRIASITLNPFRYNGAKQILEVIQEAEIEISYDNRAVLNEIYGKSIKKVEAFENLYASRILNYQESTSKTDYQNPTILYIYPSPLENNPILNNLLNWRKQEGWTVFDASTAETGSSLTSIKSYIQNAYDNWENPPAYVTLIGDAEGPFSIPTYTYTVDYYTPGGDHWYCLLDGDDELEDIFIGRLSISSLIDLSTIVTKTIKYEKASVIPDSTYYNRTLLVGATGHNTGQSAIITNKYVKEVMQSYNEDYNFIEYYDSAVSPNLITNGMNTGVAFWNYRGWMNMDGWGTEDAYALNNVDKLTVSIVLTCATGTFYTGTSVTEAIVRAGSASVPTGGVCSVGLATTGTHTAFNNCLNGGMVEHLFINDGWTMGGALNNGKFYLWEAYNQSKPDKVKFFSTICNLIGDSALRVYKEKPKYLDVEYLSNIPAGSDQYHVRVKDNNVPQANVWVTLNIGTDYYTDYTDNQGEVFLDIPSDASGQGLLTLSKEAYKPRQFDLTFGEESPLLSASDFQLYLNGEEVDYLTPGNQYDLTIQTTNNSNVAVMGVTASITILNDGVNIIDGQANYGDIQANESQINVDNFSFELEDIAFNNDLVLKLHITNSTYNWESRMIIPILSPIIQVQNFTIEDQNFAPGGTSQINVILENEGTLALSNAQAVLTSQDTRLTITNGTYEVGSILTGETASATYTITASDQLLPNDRVPVKISITDSDFETECYFAIPMGEVEQSDPFGPDAYGYYIYDSFDTSYNECPEYNWIELDPELGGFGTFIELDDNGVNQEKIANVDLPFSFKFYGQDYDSITICSNGWLALGETEQATFRNWRLPGPLGPSPMIAPFWDDLIKGTNGKVFIAHNQAEHYFIVSWNEWRNNYNPSYEETFQVLLYDPDYYASSTGDSTIKIQYKVVNNVDSASGTVHGEYASVGIEDHTGTIGLEYTYNNNYPQAAHPLQNEMALYITTKIGQLPPFVMYEPTDLIFNEDFSNTDINLLSVFRDPNNDELEYTFDNSNNLQFSVSENAYLTITPELNWNGSETVTVYAKDTYNDIQASVSFLVTVLPVNDRPSLQSKIPEDTNFEAVNNFVSFSVDVLDVDSELMYEWKVDNNTILEAQSDSLYYIFNSVGEHEVKCYASDSDFTVIASWNVNVPVDNVQEILPVNSLSQNSPNPFNPSTSINFSLQKNSDVAIIIYNVKGQKVRTLVSDYYSQGKHQVVWDGLDDKMQALASGVYFYRIITDTFSDTRKAVLMK